MPKPLGTIIDERIFRSTICLLSQVSISKSASVFLLKRCDMAYLTLYSVTDHKDYEQPNIIIYLGLPVWHQKRESESW